MDTINIVLLEQSSHTEISENANNLVIGGNNAILKAMSAGLSISGFKAPPENPNCCNTFLGFFYNGGSNAVTLKNESEDSVEGNRIKTLNGLDLSLPVGSIAYYCYVEDLFRIILVV